MNYQFFASSIPVMVEVRGRSSALTLLSSGTNFRATNSEFDTASEVGTSSSKNMVNAVNAAVIIPKLACGNNCSTVATIRAVL